MSAKAKDGPVAYLNGRFVPANEAVLPVHDAAIVLGATATDMTRTFRHRPFRLQDHMLRFYAAARYAYLQPPLSMSEAITVATELIERNAALLKPESDLALVQFLSPGPIGLYAGRACRAGSGPPTFCMHTFELPFALWRPLLLQGAHVVIPSVRHVPVQCVAPQIKCRSRMHWWLAECEVRLADPNALPICLDLDGNLTESSGANFVLVRDGQVLSPQRRSILWGISLDTVVQLCKQLGIPFVTRDLQLYDLVCADEAMLCSTPYCLVPISHVNGQLIGSGQPGPVFQRLISAWSDRVGLDIIGQILECGK